MIRDILYWQERARKAEERNVILVKQIHDTADRLGDLAAEFRRLEYSNVTLQAVLDIATVGRIPPP
jgi:hypothetical protein